MTIRRRSKQESTSNFKDKVKINPHRIDQEILQQSQRYWEAADLAAESENELEDAKEAHDSYRTKLERKVRRYPEKYLKGASTTDASVKAYVDTHKEVIRLRLKVIDAKKVKNTLLRAEKSMYMRKEMIEKYLYWIERVNNGNVRVPIDIQNDRTKRTSSEIRRHLNTEE